MLTLKRDGTKLAVTLDHGLLGNGGGLLLSWDAGTELLAEALLFAVRDHVEKTVEAVRRLEYEQGWKDARSRKRPARKWFRANLKPEAP